MVSSVDLDEIFEFQTGVVVQHDQSHHSTTHVTSTYNASTKNTDIHSHVSHHQDQKIWYRDCETNAEEFLSLHNVDFQIREGHYIGLVHYRKTGVLVQVTNITTGSHRWINGLYGRRFVENSLYAIFFAVPFLNVLLAAAAFIWTFVQWKVREFYGFSVIKDLSLLALAGGTTWLSYRWDRLHEFPKFQWYAYPEGNVIQAIQVAILLIPSLYYFVSLEPARRYAAKVKISLVNRVNTWAVPTKAAAQPAATA